LRNWDRWLLSTENKVSAYSIVVEKTDGWSSREGVRNRLSLLLEIPLVPKICAGIEPQHVSWIPDQQTSGKTFWASSPSVVVGAGIHEAGQESNILDFRLTDFGNDEVGQASGKTEWGMNNWG